LVFFLVTGYVLRFVKVAEAESKAPVAPTRPSAAARWARAKGTSTKLATKQFEKKKGTIFQLLHSKKSAAYE